MPCVFSRRGLFCILLVGAAAALALLAQGNDAQTADRQNPSESALARTRDTIKMLDDVHKAYVVNITATYVKAQETTPAARVTKKVFKHMEEKGWHTGRLIDATGDPFNKENCAKSDFEKRALSQLKNGKPYYEEVAFNAKGPVLRAATQVPVVMKACITCHAAQKEGDLLGALVYEVPIR